MIAHMRVLLVGLGLLLVLAPAAYAQDSSSARGKGVITSSDGGVLGAATATSVVLIGSDLKIARWARASSLQENAFARNTMKAASFAADPGAVVAGVALWASGRFSHDRTQELIGMRSLEAVVASGAVTGALKFLAGRARPDQSPDSPRDFVFGRGFPDRSEYQSFPSGHATAAFAFASAVDGEWKQLSPHRPAWAGGALYAVAALSAFSRVYLDRHWASDVVMGSAIGFVAGRAVVRWHSDAP